MSLLKLEFCLNSTKPEKEVKGDINWNTAYRSYSPSSSTNNNNKSSNAHDKQITLEPQASDSDDSLNLCVPSQMPRPSSNPQGRINFLDELSSCSEDEEEENARNEAVKIKRDLSRDDPYDTDIRDCGLPDPVIEFEIDGQIFDFTEKVRNLIYKFPNIHLKSSVKMLSKSPTLQKMKA